MNSRSILFLVNLAVSCPTVLAAENTTPPDWEPGDGLSVQSQERVDQINRYKKQQDKLETKALEKEWSGEGLNPQPGSRVDHLNKQEKQRRTREINAIKCAMCEMRCGIVKDAGHRTCEESQTTSVDLSCSRKADDFLRGCLDQCLICQSEPDDQGSKNLTQ